MSATAKPEAEDAYRIDTQLLSDLWVFRVVARQGSVTAAASAIRVTQGAVSQRVTRLEGRLGTAFFSRKSGRLSLTDAGATLLDAMDRVAVTLNDTVSRFDRVQKRSLVVSCVPSLAVEWLAPRLDEFYRDNPNVELFVRAEMISGSAEQIHELGIDVVIAYERDDASGLHELATLPEMIVPVCSRTYRDEMRDREAPEITRLHDDAAAPGCPSGFEWSEWVAANPTWKDRVVGERRFNLAHLAYHAALVGQGVAMGRAVLINRLLARGELVAATDLPPIRSAHYRVLATRPGGSRSPVRSFAGWVMRAMQRTQDETLEMLELNRS
jgi:LysR family glycine cleavage system transcriptional activator